jgi:glyoxylase-like metal-dependent hydrolase (beta-lactamase superfamily II)
VEPGQYDERDVQARDCTRFGISNSMIPVKNDPVLYCLRDGDIYRNGDHYFKVIHTPGHDDWGICLYEPEEKLLISGDHILERITPTIMSWINGYDALREYLNSLDTVRDLDVERILPGHGPIFTGLAERVDYMKQHHLDRLEELYQLVLEGHTSIIDIARSAKWKHPNWDEWTLDQKWFSMGETLAHLIYLVNEGRIILTIRQNKRRFYASTLWDSHTR